MFKDKILECRKKAGLSQEELAHQLGVSRQSVSKWENGSSFPEMDKCIELCKLFHISLDELFLNESTKTIDENLLDNITSVMQKNNRKQWLVITLALVIVCCVTLAGLTSIIMANHKLKETQLIANSFANQYYQLMEQLNSIENNLANENGSLNLNFTSIKYLNNEEAEIHLETMLQKENMNDQVEVIFEFSDEKITCILSKSELNYEADIILPLKSIIQATLVVSNGENQTNYSCFVDDQDFELKRAMQSHWLVKHVEKEKDHLVFSMSKIDSENNAIAEIQQIEFEDSKGNIVKTFSFPENPWETPNVDFDVRKQEETWTIFFVYEKNGFICRQKMGACSNHIDPSAPSLERFNYIPFDDYINPIDSSLVEILKQ